MADRIPLIVNPDANQIQELPVGDTLVVDGLSSVSITADGTIAANAAVVLTSAGKAAGISTVAESFGSETTWLTHTGGLQVYAVNNMKWDASQNAVLINWTTNASMGQYTRNMTAGVLSGNSITWNTTPESFGTQYTPAFAVNGEGGGLAAYRLSGTDDMFYKTFTLSGSTMTMGSATTLSTYAPSPSGNSPDRPYCEYLTKEGSSHYFVVSYRTGFDAEAGDGMEMIARIVKWDGQDNVTLGTEVQLGSTVTSNTDRAKIWPRIIPLEDDRFLLYDSEDYHVCTREAGTTNFRVGVANANITGGIGEASHHPVYDPRTKYLITTDHTAWSVIYFWSVDGENINYRFKVTLPSGTGSGRVEITDKGQILYSYIDGAFGNGKQIIGTFNDARDDITWAAATTWSTNADNLDNQPRLVKTTDGKVVQAYYSGSGGNEDGKSVVSQTETTTLTEDTFLGFSSSGYSDGDSARIKVLGNVTTQSGLTAGKKYYVQDDGTLSTSKGSLGVVAGKALTTTSLLVTQ
tara:strand:+ start:135 stop:1694 length:1560 start_codon:yes stop_codon:yes gene_type:complete